MTGDEVRDVLLLLSRSVVSVDLIQAYVGVDTIVEAYSSRRLGNLYARCKCLGTTGREIVTVARADLP